MILNITDSSKNSLASYKHMPVKDCWKLPLNRPKNNDLIMSSKLCTNQTRLKYTHISFLNEKHVLNVFPAVWIHVRCKSQSIKCIVHNTNHHNWHYHMLTFESPNIRYKVPSNIHSLDRKSWSKIRFLHKLQKFPFCHTNGSQTHLSQNLQSQNQLEYQVNIQ